MRPIIFGEVLFDCFPDGNRHLGGAPFNVAWHLQAFGDRPCFVSSVGMDALGDEIATAMTGWGMDTSYLQRSHQYPTGKVQVEIQHGEPSYRIASNCAYDYISLPAIEQLGDSGLIYHGTLALRNFGSRHALNDLITRLAAPVFMDVNLRSPWYEPEDVRSLMHQAQWVKLNQSELNVILPGAGTIKSKARHLLEHYQLNKVFVTCGADGALAIDAAGDALWMRPENNSLVMDSVGAGDAFSAVLIHGVLKGWPLLKTMDHAQRFASVIVSLPGAVPLSKDVYDRFLKLESE